MVLSPMRFPAKKSLKINIYTCTSCTFHQVGDINYSWDEDSLISLLIENVSTFSIFNQVSNDNGRPTGKSVYHESQLSTTRKWITVVVYLGVHERMFDPFNYHKNTIHKSIDSKGKSIDVVKTIINHPFGNSLYHLFIDIYSNLGYGLLLL